jgi:hypothetical protein
MPHKNRGKTKRKAKTKIKTPPFSNSVPPAPPVGPEVTAPATNDVLAEDALRDILGRLSVANLLRAALACHRWRRVASRCLPRSAPLLGYFFHPTAPGLPSPQPFCKDFDPHAAFAPFDASSPRLSLDFAPDADRFLLMDSHQGLLLLHPAMQLPDGVLPRLLVLDPATRRRTLLPAPPRDTLPDDRRWRSSRHYVGCALLSRAHPGRLCFEALCYALDGGHPRAWVATVNDGKCVWRALPRATHIAVDFDPYWFEGRCVHAAGKMYWHICNSARLLALDPATLRFSDMLVPDFLADHFCTFRIGETPEDGRLCILAVANQQLQLWVRGEAGGMCDSDNGWVLERVIMDMDVVYDQVPDLPKHDDKHRFWSVWPSDLDAGRTGKAFIRTWGYGRYSLDLNTRKMERLATKRGKNYGHPIFAYILAWPPAFLAPEH